MRIGVIADTHVHRISELPSSLINELTRMDMVLHLGDFHSEDLVNDLKEISDFHGVAGNHDMHIPGLPEKDLVEVNGKRIGIIHGHGCVFPFGFKWGLMSQFEGKMDAILYGHTHSVRNTIEEGVLFFNPGSVCGRFPAMHRSYGVLTVGEELRGEIITIEIKRYFYLNKYINLASKAISYCCGLNSNPHSFLQ
ncbi:MAG: metallophosphoesterase family protein [Chloroflexi bacterium]|jgi:putative phosphoesterase|nr:metallophosphoesterase family protein [Chloroflexota bacterium]